MTNKFADPRGIKRFYYSPGSHYCVIVGEDEKAVRHIREAVLTHYLGNCHGNYKRAEFVSPKRSSTKLAGELIHVKENIADRLRDDKQLDDIQIDLCPVDFNDHKQRKSGLHQLVDMVRP
ncbi:hypothetical protein KY343_05370 [Candidatus Woesearchaeota archaeon]|nr:hypothetical protein [Candidatus Woesearchaeota archaeon]